MSDAPRTFQCTATEQPRSGAIRVQVERCTVDGEIIREGRVFHDANKATIFMFTHWVEMFL